MLKISRLADYGSNIMRYFASGSVEINHAQNAVAVSEKTRIALPTVRKILKLLQVAGLLISERGKEGGYRLARPVDQITLVEIIEAIDGPIALTDCNSAHNSCGHTQNCAMKKDWQWINEVVRDALAAKTLGARGGIKHGD